MPAKDAYIIAPLALLDLEEIGDYIAQDSLDNAVRMVAELREHMSKLAAMPRMGHRREDLTKNETLAFWPVGRYIIIYRPDNNPIEIVRVFHSARDIARLLKS